MGLFRLREFPHDSGPSTFSGFHEGKFHNYIGFRNAREPTILNLSRCYSRFSKFEEFWSCSTRRRNLKGCFLTLGYTFQRRIGLDRIRRVIIAGSPRCGKSNDSDRMPSRSSPNEFQQGDLISVLSTASIPHRPHARVRAAKLSSREICFRRSQRNGDEIACRGVLSENICPYSVQPNSQPVRSDFRTPGIGGDSKSGS